MNKKSYGVKVVYWREAFFFFKKRLPVISLPVQITFGVIISENKESINLGINCEYDKNKKLLKVIDGIFIPKRTILKIKQIGKI